MWGGRGVWIASIIVRGTACPEIFSRFILLLLGVFHDTTSISPRSLSTRFPVHHFNSYFAFHTS